MSTHGDPRRFVQEAGDPVTFNGRPHPRWGRRLAEFNPWHDELGRFASGPGAKTGELDVDVTVDAKGKRAMQNQLDRLAEANGGLTQDEVADMMADEFNGLSDAQKQAGVDWYPNTNAWCGETAERYPTPGGKDGTIGATAGLSPNMSWEDPEVMWDNKRLVEKYASEISANPMVDIPANMNNKNMDLNITNYAQTEMGRLGNVDTTNYLGKDFSGMQRLQDLPPDVQYLAITTLIDPSFNGTFNSMNDIRAIGMLNGQSVDKTLGGQKARSFANNIAAPKTSRSVTADAFHGKAINGDKTITFSAGGKYSNQNYETVRSTTQAAADRTNPPVLPSVLQAALWPVYGGGQKKG